MSAQPHLTAPTSEWISLDHTLRFYRGKSWRIVARDFPQVLYRRTGLPFYLLSPARATHILIARGLLKPLRSRREIEQLEQYAACFSRLSPDSVVYSVGVADNIYFDAAIASRVGCAVDLFDPTPLAVTFMSTVSRRDLRFHPTAIWLLDGELELFSAETNGTGGVTGSVTNQFCSNSRIKVPCQTLETAMRTLGHDHVDLLKMDIEGGALPVLERMLETPVRPRQIVVELERPIPLASSVDYWARLITLFRGLKRAGYSSYLISDKKGISLEVICLYDRAEAGRGS